MNGNRLNGSDGKNISALVQLTTYAIMGGVARKPVSIAFRDFPQDVLAAFWGYFAGSVDSEQVAEVWLQSDVRTVGRHIHDFRLVLVYPGNANVRAGNVLDWMVEHRRGKIQTLPALLSVHRNGNRSHHFFHIAFQCTILQLGNAFCNVSTPLAVTLVR
jgi:hypothetical protein